VPCLPLTTLSDVDYLAALRVHAKATFPDATWLPGDPPPVGTVVCESGSTRAAVVVGDCPAPRVDVDPHCASCRCMRSGTANFLLGFWRVRFVDPTGVPLQEDGTPVEGIWYPPTLRLAWTP
jgi:hypothetical protein